MIMKITGYRGRDMNQVRKEREGVILFEPGFFLEARNKNFNEIKTWQHDLRQDFLSMVLRESH